MKQNYSTIWISTCLCMCLSLCAHVSAQSVTSFAVQRPDFISYPEQLTVIISEIPFPGQEWVGWEMYAHYNPQTDRYEAYEIETSGEYTIKTHISFNEGNVYSMPYAVQRNVVAGGTMELDIRNVYHRCDITLKDYAGNPFPYVHLSDPGYGNGYSSDDEGKLTMYMPDGDYEYILTASNYSPVRKTITMAGADMNVSFGFEDHRKVDFRVKDHNGDWMAGAYVQLEDGERSFSLSTDGQGMGTMFLTDGTYSVNLSASGYIGQDRDVVVNSSIGVTDFSFESYKRFTAKVKNGPDTDVNVEMVYLFSIDGDDDYDSGIGGYSRDFFYAPPGVYTFKVQFDATFSKRGLAKIDDKDVAKEFDFSDYKKAIIECGSEINNLQLTDPKRIDEDSWFFYFPESPGEEIQTVQNTKSVEVYLPAGEYLLNGYETPQTGMKINLTQSGQRFVYDTKRLEEIEIELKFVNAPVDERLLSSWYGEFTPEGYTGSIGISAYSRMLPAGNYTYFIDQEAYSSSGDMYAFVKQGSCRIDANNKTVEVDLKNYRLVNFNVLSPDGEELEYPILEIFRDGEPILEVEGTRCLLEDGDYKILAWDEDENDTEVYQKWVSFTISGANRVINVQFERTNTSIVFAELRGEAYEIVDNAEIIIAGKAPEYVHSYISLFTDIPCGEVDYRILVKGQQVQAGTVNIVPNESNYLTFFVESSATGINDMHESKLSMVQNGDKLMLYSEDGKPYTASIYAMNGSKMLERNLSGDDELSIQSFGSGVYILRMAGADGVKTFKFIKK